jgi:hypothetical protein
MVTDSVPSTERVKASCAAPQQEQHALLHCGGEVLQIQLQEDRSPVALASEC